MSTTPTSPEKKFDWPLCHEAEELWFALLDTFTTRNGFAAGLQQRMHAETGTLLLDWIDHLVVPIRDEAPFRDAGYVTDPLGDAAAGVQVLWHPEAMLPRVLIEPDGHGLTIALRCDEVADFLAAHGLSTRPEGAPLSRFRLPISDKQRGYFKK